MLVLICLILSNVFGQDKTIYDFTVKGVDGEYISLQLFKGKVLLIVNTATECGFTPQYTGLQKLYDVYKEKGFEILDFPCNQFENQAPGTDKEINNFCTLNYHTTFSRFAKIDVNGENESPLYEYLKNYQKDISASKDIEWNFTKFLIDREGNLVKRYNPGKKPGAIEKDIKKQFGL
ncbi:MAG: glutathione peroxidase [Chitinispirillales bacterium]|nr:glutathione peroxidase [Chitinispirillales bacterium]